MTTDTGNSTDVAMLRALLEQRVAAVHAKDIDGLMASVAPNIESFDVLAQLHYSGADAVRRRAEQWFSSYRTEIGYELRDVAVAAGDDVAFCRYLYHVSGTTTGGDQVSMWVRATTCCQKRDGRWIITHEHQSVPFDVASGKALLDLEP